MTASFLHASSNGSRVSVLASRWTRCPAAISSPSVSRRNSQPGSFQLQQNSQHSASVRAVPGVDIVPYSASHRDGVMALVLPIQQSEFGIPIALQDQPDIVDVDGFYRNGNGNFWVALAGTVVVGTIGLLDIGNGVGALRKMFVSAPLRGAEWGVARRLLGTLLRWCGAHGFTSVYLGTTDKFLAAHRFYQKNGFIEIAKGELPPAFPVMSVDSRFYRLALASGQRAAQSGAGEQARRI